MKLAVGHGCPVGTEAVYSATYAVRPLERKREQALGSHPASA